MHTLAARSAGGIEVAEGYPYNGVPASCPQCRMEIVGLLLTRDCSLPLTVRCH